MNDAEWDRLFSLYQRVLQAVGFKLPGETSVQSGVGLGAGRLSWVREAIEEVGCRNYLPCLRTRLFPKSVRSALGVLGMSDPVYIYLQYFDLKEG